MTNPLAEIWKFFSPFLKTYQIRLIGLLILPIVWCLVETIAPYLIKIIIDKLAVEPSHPIESQNLIIYMGIFYAFLICILEFSVRACNYLWIKTFPKIRANIQSKVLELIQMQPFHFIYNQFAGDLINKYRNLSDSFEKIFKILLYGFYPTLLSFFFALIFISLINILFSIIFLCWFMSMNLVTFLFFKRSLIAAKEQSSVQNRLIGYVGNFICNAITMIAFPRTLSEQVEFRRLIQKNIFSTEKLEFVTFKADVWRSLASWFLLSSMIIFLGFGWQKSWITLGDFSFICAICFYVRRSIWMTSLQLSELFKEIGIIKEALPLVSDVSSSFKDIPDEIQSNIPTVSRHSIDFYGICFGYRPDKMIFDNLNLHIPVAQKLGITGGSGTGKTSLIQLLLRLYDPFQGTIKISGKNYKEFSLKNLRGLFSYVPQNVSLLHCSIFDNIAFGKLNASKDEVYEAAHICLCDEFISSLEKGYDTVIGEGGHRISGGQRQRIALARAYIKKAPIFILDEALSGLEPDLEEKLLQRLCENLKDHIIILISHRESALLKMERVIRLKQGQITRDDFCSRITESNGEQIWQKEHTII
jgi:ATP-binding cassette subfamily B protein